MSRASAASAAAPPPRTGAAATLGMMRSKAHVEEGKGDKKMIVLTEIPFQVGKSGLVEKIAEDLESGSLGRKGKKGREGFDALANERGLDIVTFRDWKKIEEAEERAAREGAPREKFVDIEAMIRAAN